MFYQSIQACFIVSGFNISLGSSNQNARRCFFFHGEIRKKSAGKSQRVSLNRKKAIKTGKKRQQKGGFVELSQGPLVRRTGQTNLGLGLTGG